MEFPNDSTATITSMNKSDEAFMEDSGIVSNVDTGGLISEIGTTTPTVYGEYDDLDLLEYVEQNAFVGVDQNFGETRMQIDDSSAVFDAIVENQSCYRTEQENPIPNLIKLICDEDLVVVHQAAQMILQLAKKETSNAAITNNPEVVVALVRILSTTNDFETIRAATGTLHNLSYSPQGLEHICKYDGIPALVKCLGTSSVALVAIHNLLLFKKGSEMAICEAGGLQKMVSLLRKDNVKFLTIVTDCLYSLAYGNEQNKLVILASNGPAELVRILRTYHYEKLLWTTSKVLKVLSACSSNKQAIVHAGGMQALATHLDYAKVASPRLVRTVLWTLRNLSDAATEIEGVEELLNAVVQFLNCGDEYIVTCAAGILCNMTCNNQRNKLTVCQAGGIDALIRAISVAGSCEKITEPAVCALRHVTSRHCESEAAQNEVRLCFGIDVIMNLLKPSSGWPLIKAVIGLLRNLALCSANQETLREHSAVHHLGNLLTFTVNEMRKQKNCGSANNLLEGGVRLEEIIEGSIGALQILSRDPVNRDIMHSQRIIPLLTELFLGDNESIQKLAANILWEFGHQDSTMMSNL
ncbi:hypothetical protein V9T40_000272 [Parthenolecanium corni]|uniref:Armadillo segment polarity protein n=1 Tax=Parthenolecanium corni TaxID=536013 RepID=A0AAN9Y1K0_9HEMI